jgi:hypothetical protein
MKTHSLIALALLSIILAACAAGDPPSEPTAADDITPVVVTEAATPVAPAGTVDFGSLTPLPPSTGEPQEMPAPGIPDPARAMASRTSQDLAERLGIDVSAVEVVEVVGMDWPDSSVGCPDPDMGYLTVITPGYRIVLEAEGEQYTYHTDMREYFVYCVDGRPVP